jgi:hypothetical protein
MISVQPPRDWFSTLAGLAAAAALALLLGYTVWGPGRRMAAAGWQEVWVTIVAPDAAKHGVAPDAASHGVATGKSQPARHT